MSRMSVNNDKQELSQSIVTTPLPGKAKRLLVMVGALGISIGALSAFLYYRGMLFNYAPQELTLRDIDAYVQQLPEYPVLDTPSYAIPSYGIFLKSQKPSLVANAYHTLVATLGMPFLQPRFSCHLLPEVLDAIAHQEHSSSMNKAHIIGKIKPDDDTQIFLWGDMEGALHSFVRCLHKLEEQGIIASDLTIKKRSHYCLFLGDVVGRSPYNVPLLTLITLFMSKNPDNVFYLQGEMEGKNGWKEYKVDKEFYSRFSSSKAELLESKISSFFSSLPRAFFVEAPGIGTAQFIRISYFPRTDKEIVKESLYADALVKDMDKGHALLQISENEHIQKYSYGLQGVEAI
jgi:hypothetical protein